MRRRILLYLSLLIGLAACTPGATAVLPAAPLPTLAAAAAVPTTTAAAATALALAGLPPTFTPDPRHTSVATASPIWQTPTAGPTSTPFPTLTATPSPTMPAAAQPIQADTLSGPPNATDCGSAGYVFASQFSSAYGNRAYHAYLPPCYRDDGAAYPVLYLFHGSIQTDTHWLELGLAALVDEGIRTGRYPPFIVIMPFNDSLGNMTSGGPNSIEGVTVNSLLPYVARNFCSWESARGRSLGGISRGGYWALMIAFRHPDLFGAVAGHSSHLRFETDAPQYNPLATYATADLSQMRIWLDWGETDFLRAGQEQLRDSLIAAGISHTATVNPGGHNETYWTLHLREYLDWHAAGWSLDRDSYPNCS
ncbi:MAG: hypothetical protein KDE59_15840 [Anaerolineales bacterium]|nr:hypothetical protein [Anaerolineales bacterium]